MLTTEMLDQLFAKMREQRIAVVSEDFLETAEAIVAQFNHLRLEQQVPETFTELIRCLQEQLNQEQPCRSLKK